MPRLMRDRFVTDSVEIRHLKIIHIGPYLMTVKYIPALSKESFHCLIACRYEYRDIKAYKTQEFKEDSILKGHTLFIK